MSAYHYQHAVCLCTNVTTKTDQVQSHTRAAKPRSQEKFWSKRVLWGEAAAKVTPVFKAATY